MDFKRFTIIKKENYQETTEASEVILINMSQVISIKPIKIVLEEVLDGYWLRLSNGKKYRAIEIPSEIEQLIFH